MPAVGGVARRAKKIIEARNHNEFVLLLDAGDSLTGDQAPATTTPGRTSVEIMNLLGYDALALGPQDLALGLDVLRKRMSEARFAVLSANAADAATGAAIAQPYVIRTIAGHRIAIIGLSDAAETQDIIVSDPVAAAQAAVAAVADRADIIILLSHAGLAEDQTIAETVPGIDVIVSGGPGVRPEPARHPTTGTLIVHADEAQPGHAGRVLGRQTLTFDATGQLQQVQIEYIQLGPEIADDAKIAAWVEGATAK
ncbi:MAG: hypothetical protein WAV70_10810 [Anaerolineae bacterium]